MSSPRLLPSQQTHSNSFEIRENAQDLLATLDLANPASVYVVDSTSHKRGLVAKQERDDAGDFWRFRAPLLDCDLQPALDILGVFSSRHWGVDRSYVREAFVRKTV